MTNDEAVQHAVLSLSSAQRQSYVHAHLMDCGLSREQANDAITAALEQVQAKKDAEARRRRRSYKSIGLALVLIGIAVLVYTYLNSYSLGAFAVPAGLIGYGAYMLATGEPGALSK